MVTVDNSNKEEQIEMACVTQAQELRRPDRAIIKCTHRDEHVEELVNHYALMNLKYTVIIDPKYTEAIDIDLVLGEEVLDGLLCPYFVKTK